MIVDPPYYVRVCQAACLAQLGRIEEARLAISEDAPADFDTAQFARRCAALCDLPADKEHWLEGFRKAGIAV
jgi:hypothetical protein